MPHKRVQQYCGPRGLIERLARDLRALQQATTAAAALDCAITYCCTAWGLTTWLFMPVAREASLRRQLAWAADRGMANIDPDIFGSIMSERCPDLELCAALATDPSKLAVQSTGADWLLLFLEDGEATPIGLQRLEGVAQFWQEFVRKYLADQPITRRAA